MASLSNTQVQKIINVVKQFEVEEGNIDIIEPFGAGRINKTYKITIRREGLRFEYLLQNVNHYVFPDTKGLMENLTAVTDYIRKNGGEAIQYIKLKDIEENSENQNGPYIYIFYGDKNACEHWRMYHYIEADVYSCIINQHHAYILGDAIAKFSKSLEGFDTQKLIETIPDFHNTPKRFNDLLYSITLDAVNHWKRIEGVEKEVDFIIQRKDKLGVIVEALEKGEIPYRVSHNDPKLSNVLFDKQKNTPICMIDLDTMMPGSGLFDVGDAIRSIANMASEDDKDIHDVKFSTELYTEFVNGYLKGMGDKLTQKEKALIPMSVWVITMELGIRFLKDHIDKNVYFKTDYDGQNIERARIQFALVSKIEEELENGTLQKVLQE